MVFWTSATIIIHSKQSPLPTHDPLLLLFVGSFAYLHGSNGNVVLASAPGTCPVFVWLPGSNSSRFVVLGIHMHVLISFSISVSFVGLRQAVSACNCSFFAWQLLVYLYLFSADLKVSTLNLSKCQRGKIRVLTWVHSINVLQLGPFGCLCPPVVGFVCWDTSVCGLLPAQNSNKIFSS